MAAQDSNGPEANSSATTPLNQTDPTGSGTTTSNLKVPLYGNAGQEAGHLIGDREGLSLLLPALRCFVCFDGGSFNLPGQHSRLAGDLCFLGVLVVAVVARW
jgi:hypothetical protein